MHVRSVGLVGSTTGDALCDDGERATYLAGATDEAGEMIAVEWVGKRGRCGHGESSVGSGPVLHRSITSCA